ncbi:MAG TPA: type II toxin-antitoxin system prevent-host-death family antitoxin [Stellaceae bacterium]|nr:type II toxin-antitoxin system prevent-host-death family antitoxin [Stellaceae bacterium]
MIHLGHETSYQDLIPNPTPAFQSKTGLLAALARLFDKSRPAKAEDRRKDAEEARNRLPELLAAAEKGQSTIITRHGRPVAALVPFAACGARRPPSAAAACRGLRPRAMEKGGRTAPAPFAGCARNGAARSRRSAEAGAALCSANVKKAITIDKSALTA